MEIDGDSDGSEVGHCEAEGTIEGCSGSHERQRVQTVSCNVLCRQTGRAQQHCDEMNNDK